MNREDNSLVPVPPADLPGLGNGTPLSRCRLLDLPVVEDRRGNLTFIEGRDNLPFLIERVYYLYDVPGGAERGGHAHRDLEEFIVAISGSFDVIISDAHHVSRIHLNRPYFGIYVGSMVWRSLDNFSSGSVCLVLASAPYDEDDYYRDSEIYVRDLKGLAR